MIPFNYTIILLFVSSLLVSCNLANSASYEEATPDEGLDTPTASLTITNAPSDNRFQEREALEISVSGQGSRNSKLASCVTSLYPRLNTSAFSTTAVNTAESCTSATITPPSNGEYRLELVVTDDNSMTAKDEASIIITETVLNAEFTATNPTGTLINLDASDSRSGSNGEIVSYAWQVRLKVDDSSAFGSVTQTNSSPTTSVSVETDGIYVIQLTVTDGNGNTDIQQESISINATGTFIPDFNSGATEYNELVDNDATDPFEAPGNLLLEITNSGAFPDDVNRVICNLYDSSSLDTIVETANANFLNVTTPSCELPVVAAATYIVEVKVILNNEAEYQRRRVFVSN